MSIGPFPEANAKDRARLAFDALLGGVPYIGPGLEKLANEVVVPSLERRQSDWLNKLAEVVDELAEQGITVDVLAGNEEFVSSLSKAMRIALGTHLEEKVDYLKAALVHTASSGSGRDMVVYDYFDLIDRLEPEHVRLLLHLRRLHAKPAAAPINFAEVQNFLGDEKLTRSALFFLRRLDLVDLISGIQSSTGPLGTTSYDTKKFQIRPVERASQFLDFINFLE